MVCPAFLLAPRVMTTISRQQVFNTLDNLYDAAQTGSSEAWIPVYEDISSMVSSNAGALSLFRLPGRELSVVTTTAPPEALKEYTDYYHSVSPFFETIVKLRPGEYFSRIESYPDEQLEKTEFYQDFLRKHDIFQIEYHPLFDMPDLKGGISFTRPKSNPNICRDERRILNFLLPHIQRAFQLYLMIAEANSAKSRFTEALSRLSESVIILDRSARAVFLNAAAETIVGEKDGLEIGGNMIVSTSSRRESKAFKAALEAVFVDDLEKISNPGGMMQISRPSGRRSLQLLFLPFSEPEFKSHPSPQLAMILLYDPEHRAQPAEAVLSQLYDLTPAEAQIGIMLARGESISAAAEQLAVTTNTARTHLKRIFSKTDTNRQSELISLLSNSAGSFPSPSSNSQK